MATPSRPPPRLRIQFEIAIICVLKSEFDAVQAIFDFHWDDMKYGKAVGDPNTYKYGRIGDHDVVLAFLPRMGKVSSANVASALRSSFTNLQLGLIVGVCGAAPIEDTDGKEIILGDVIISTGVVQVDFGRQFAEGIHRKNTLLDNLGQPNQAISTYLVSLTGLRSGRKLREQTHAYLQKLLEDDDFKQNAYPGAENDQVFDSKHRHKHHNDNECRICAECRTDNDPVCDMAEKAACSDLGCKELLKRKRLSGTDPIKPLIHLGLIATSDQVMKSAIHRDKLVEKEDVIGFEMEAAGAWDNLPTVIIKGVCDYADSHKNKTWQGYASMSAAACMKAFLEGWELTDEPSKPRITMDIYEKYVQMFRCQDYEGQKNRITLSAPNTCQWLIRHPMYDIWRTNPVTGLLWITANPGCGKSVLARYLIDKKFDETAALVCYHLFARNADMGQDSATAGLCNILHQIFAKYPESLFHVHSKITDFGPGLCKSLDQLWIVLLELVQKAHLEPIICVLDGLDECCEPQQAALIKKLAEFQAHDRTRWATPFKILIMSQPKVLIGRQLRQEGNDTTKFHIPGEEDSTAFDQEIIQFIKHEIQRVAHEVEIRDEILPNLQDRMLRVPNRSYLWATLVFKGIRLCTGKTQKKLMSIIEELPQTIEDAYESLLRQSRNSSETLRLLQVLLVCERPLTIKEIDVVLAIDTKSIKGYSDLELEGELGILETIKQIGCLLVVVSAGRLYFIHETVREFLVGEQMTTIPKTLLLQWRNSIDIRQAHESMARLCIQHLYFRDFSTIGLRLVVEYHSDYRAKIWVASISGLKNLQVVSEVQEKDHKLVTLKHTENIVTPGIPDDPEEDIPDKELKNGGSILRTYGSQKRVLNYAQNHTWLSYSAIFWHIHARHAGRLDSDLFEKAVSLYEVESTRFHTWFGVYWFTGPCSQHLLFAGLELAMMFRPKLFLDYMRQSVREFHTRMCLTEQIITIPEQVTSLQPSSLVRLHAGLIQRTLDSNILALNQTWAMPGLPLSIDAPTAQYLRDIWDTGNVARRDLYYTTPGALQLLQNYTRAASVDDKRRERIARAQYQAATSLFKAVKSADEPSIYEMLEHGIPVHIKNEYGETILHVAAEHGHLDLLRLFIALFISLDLTIDIRNNSGCTPLDKAVAYNHFSTVEFLLEMGADTRATQNGGGFILGFPVSKGQYDLTKLLLDNGANVNAVESSYGFTPLTMAIEARQPSIAKLIIQYGADVNVAHGMAHIQPLLLAIQYHMYEVVDFLLKYNARVNTVDRNGRTPLHWTVHKTDNLGLAERFVALGVRVNARDRIGNTALDYAKDTNPIFVEMLSKASAAELETEWPPSLTWLVGKAMPLVEMLSKQINDQASDPMLGMRLIRANHLGRKGWQLPRSEAVESELWELARYMQRPSKEEPCETEVLLNVHAAQDLLQKIAYKLCRPNPLEEHSEFYLNEYWAELRCHLTAGKDIDYDPVFDEDKYDRVPKALIRDRMPNFIGAKTVSEMQDAAQELIWMDREAR